MSIDITSQIAVVRHQLWLVEGVSPRDRWVTWKEDREAWRAILATLERVAAEERPAGSLQ